MLNLLGMMTSPDVPALFFINGGRGSGKSTFLQSLRKSLCEPTHYECKIDVLAEVDPTELADTEDFLFTSWEECTVFSRILHASTIAVNTGCGKRAERPIRLFREWQRGLGCWCVSLNQFMKRWMQDSLFRKAWRLAMCQVKGARSNKYSSRCIILPLSFWRCQQSQKGRDVEKWMVE